MALGIHSRPGFGRLIDKQLLLPICPPTSLVRLRNYFGRWATALPRQLSKRKIFFNPCLVCPIHDRSLRQQTFPFGALRSEQMAPARLTAQDFPGASHFKALGYRLFRLTSSDRFWHKEPVKYAWPRDSQEQNPAFSQVRPPVFSVRPHRQQLQIYPIMPTRRPIKTTTIAPMIERIRPAG